RHLPHLPSFPTRRSSDLINGPVGLQPETVDRRGAQSHIVADRERCGNRRIARLLTEIRARKRGTAVERNGHGGDGPVFWSKRARSEEHTSELQSRFDLVC